MHTSCSEKEKSQRIKNVLSQMGLKKVANSRIGHPGAADGISGGEMKRLSVASEVSDTFLVDSPSLRFRRGAV